MRGFSRIRPNYWNGVRAREELEKAAALFAKVPKDFRLKIGQLLCLTPPPGSAALDKDISLELQSLGLLEGYQLYIQEWKHTTIPKEVSIAAKCVHLCKVEANLADEALLEVRDFVIATDPGYFDKWLDEIVEKAEKAPLDLVTSNPRSYRGTASQERELIQRGRQLLEAGRELECSELPFDHIAGDPTGSGWKELLVLSQERPVALVPLLERVFDPCARLFLKLNIERRKDAFGVGVALIRSKRPACVFLGIETSLSVLGRIGSEYGNT